MMSAASAVLNTGELVINICDHLDELSLVRVQGVSIIFRDLVRGTRKFRRRLCIDDGERQAVNARHKFSASIAFNPLLDWFTTRMAISANNFDGSIHNAGFSIVLTILPHTTRALENEDASWRKMFLTTEPIHHIDVVTFGDLSCRSRDTKDEEFRMSYFALSSVWTGGVMMSSILQCASRPWISPRRRSCPIQLSIPMPYRTDEATSKRYRQFPKHDLWMELKLWRRAHGILPPAGYPLDVEFAVKYGMDEKLAVEWYRVTGTQECVDSTMADQRKIMIKFMDKQNRLVAKQTRPYAQDYPAWPALAWKDNAWPISNDTGPRKMPYEVDYAGGLVFNRKQPQREKTSDKGSRMWSHQLHLMVKRGSDRLTWPWLSA